MSIYQQAIKKLQEAVLARQQALPQNDLESLDTAVYFAARDMFVRFVDTAGWSPTGDPDLASQCYAEMVKARDCIDANAYPGAEKCDHWMQETTELVRRMADGEKIEKVLSEAIAELSS
jgi:hypothetical protein